MDGERGVRAELGRRLRAIRVQQALSLHEVEARSDGAFKASVLGAYERGARAVSLDRLVSLAEFYGVPADQLVPPGSGSRVDHSRRGESGSLTLNLVRLGELDAPDAVVVGRYSATVQLARGDFNGRVLTIRGDDVRVIAAVLGRGTTDFALHLEELGARIPSGG